MKQHIATLTFNAPAEEHMAIFAVQTEAGYFIETAHISIIRGKAFETLEAAKSFVRAAYGTLPWGLCMTDKN